MSEVGGREYGGGERLKLKRESRRVHGRSGSGGGAVGERRGSGGRAMCKRRVQRGKERKVGKWEETDGDGEDRDETAVKH